MNLIGLAINGDRVVTWTHCRWRGSWNRDLGLLGLGFFHTLAADVFLGLALQEVNSFAFAAGDNEDILIIDW